MSNHLYNNITHVTTDNETEIMYLWEGLGPFVIQDVSHTLFSLVYDHTQTSFTMFTYSNWSLVLLLDFDFGSIVTKVIYNNKECTFENLPMQAIWSKVLKP